MATSNRHKYGEARDVLAEMGIKLEYMEVERVEIQADDPADIASYSLDQIQEVKPFLVEDAGFYIEHYNGFPGPYSSYVLQKVRLPGVLKLMEGIDDRRASFKSVVAYKHGEEKRFFRGFVTGSVSLSVRGTGGFGYDPIFIPDEGDGSTFGEMAADEKNALSHRARAFRSFGAWFTGNG